MSTDNGSTNRVRTSDAEREHVAEALRNAVAEGRLSLEEGDERLGALYQTKYRDELPTLLADLPSNEDWSGGGTSGQQSGPSGGRRGRRPGWGAGAGANGPSGPWGPGGPFARSGWGPGMGPGASSAWGGAFDPRMWRRRAMFRGARVAIIVAGLVTFFAITGHFFWPIIPLFFLFSVLRLGMWHRIGAARCAAMQNQGYGPGNGAGYGGPGNGGYGYDSSYDDNYEGGHPTGRAA